jgi:very-short-patch-repair endonuclease
VAVELDGSGHLQQPGYDRLRAQAFAQLGIRTLRFTNQELRNDRRGVVSKIRAALT